MKKRDKIADKLKASLEEEKKAAKSKLNSLEAKLAKADAIFKPQDEPAPKKVKPKTIRDTFTFPEDEYELIDQLIDRALTLKKRVNKSYLVRSGLRALLELSDKDFIRTLESMRKVKIGRPRG